MKNEIVSNTYVYDILYLGKQSFPNISKKIKNQYSLST